MLNPAEWHNRWGFLRPAGTSGRTSNNHIVEGKLKFSWGDSGGKCWKSVGEKQLSERENYDNTVCYTEPTLGEKKVKKRKRTRLISWMAKRASCRTWLPVWKNGKTLFRRWLFFFYCTLILQKISLHIAAVATEIDEVSCVNESKNCWKSQQRIAAGIVTL